MSEKTITQEQWANAAPKWRKGLVAIGDATLPTKTKGMTIVEVVRLIDRVHALAVEARKAGWAAANVNPTDEDRA